MSDENSANPHALAVEVCAASSEHDAGHGHHDAHRWGPCSTHARVVGETLDALTRRLPGDDA